MEANNTMDNQVVLRCFMPDIPALKESATRMAAVPGTKLNLYAKAGEVLVVISAETHTAAASMELCEQAARRFEEDLGDTIYARGKTTMAAVTTAALMQKKRLVCAADTATGELMSEQFLSAKNADTVYDFGNDSYANGTVGPRLAAKTTEAKDGNNLADAARLMAVAAQKTTKSDYGVAFTGLNGPKGVVVAVAGKFCVFIARVAAGPDAGKQAALMALDIMRRDVERLGQSQARMFAKNKPVIWNKPMKNRSRLPLLIALIVLLAVVLGLWYVSFKLTWFDVGALSQSSAAATSQVAGDAMPSASVAVS